MNPKEDERRRCDSVVFEEWQRLVSEFRLDPGSPAEVLVARILNRIRETGS